MLSRELQLSRTEVEDTVGVKGDARGRGRC